eukprot:3179123-Rhodomonas_salina.1
MSRASRSHILVFLAPCRGGTDWRGVTCGSRGRRGRVVAARAPAQAPGGAGRGLVNSTAPRLGPARADPEGCHVMCYSLRSSSSSGVEPVFAGR